MTHELRLPLPDDFHTHLRQDEALAAYTLDAAQAFRRVLVMPNTLPPIRDAAGLEAYRNQILTHARAGGFHTFEPLMTFKLFADQDPTTIAALKAAGAVAGKLYPQGATTHSHDGARDLASLWPVFEAMEAQDLVLCIHGEDPSAFCLDREAAFLPRIGEILSDFPGLRVVLEHVTTKAAVDYVFDGPENLGATITVHHLLANLDDMLGGSLNPHLFCKPLLKRPEDQAALRQAAFAAPRRIFLGTDSAPHPRVAKECDCGAAGVYTMPVALPLLTELFVDHGGPGGPEALKRFACENGADFYRLPRNNGELVLRRESWTVPADYHEVVPFMAGKTLNWKVTPCS